MILFIESRVDADHLGVRLLCSGLVGVDFQEHFGIIPAAVGARGHQVNALNNELRSVIMAELVEGGGHGNLLFQIAEAFCQLVRVHSEVLPLPTLPDQLLAHGDEAIARVGFRLFDDVTAFAAHLRLIDQDAVAEKVRGRQRADLAPPQAGKGGEQDRDADLLVRVLQQELDRVLGVRVHLGLFLLRQSDIQAQLRVIGFEDGAEQIVLVPHGLGRVVRGDLIDRGLDDLVGELVQLVRQERGKVHLCGSVVLSQRGRGEGVALAVDVPFVRLSEREAVVCARCGRAFHPRFLRELSDLALCGRGDRLVLALPGGVLAEIYRRMVRSGLGFLDFEHKNPPVQKYSLTQGVQISYNE